jgi:putative ABC transport system permease protein
MHTLWQDLRYGARTLLKQPGFTLVAVLTLALGICGVTTQFSIVDAALLRGLPLPEPDRLVGITMRDPSWAPDRTRNLWLSDVVEFGKETRSFEGLAGYSYAAPVIANINGMPQRLSGCLVTSNFFKLLGAKPILGRDFTESDNQTNAEPVTIISHALWQSDFGGDAQIIGRTFRVSRRATTIVGVMPPGFEFPRDQLWIPIFNEWSCSQRPCGPAYVVARLKPDVSLTQAQAEVDNYLQRLAKDYPRTNEGFTVSRIEPVLNGFVARPTRQLLLSMFGAVVAVLLIACANVMNMQFARATARASEFAMRSALGASRLRLIRQLLTESLIIATLGGIGGIVLAHWAIDLFSGVMGQLPVKVMPFWMQFQIDRRVLGITVAACVASVMLSALLPALLASRVNLGEVIKSGARGHTNRLVSRLTGVLVTGQIALTCALLISSLLLIKSINNQSTLNFGFDLDAVLAGRVNFDPEFRSKDQLLDTFRSLLRHLRSSPHFTHAALSSRRLMMTNDDPSAFQIEGRVYQRPEDRLLAWEEVVSDGYFDTLGLRPIAGREFEMGDRDERRFVALVNESFARKHFGATTPIGQRVRRDDKDQWRPIVGIVPDTMMQGPLDQQRDGSAVFFPIEAEQRLGLTLVVRGYAPPSQLTEAVRSEILKVNPNLAIYLVDTPRNLMKSLLVQPRTTASLFAVFGGVATLLAAVGLYGITAFAVNRRTQEFGIRMALGADRRRILLLVLRQGGIQFILGTVLGLVLTLLLLRLGRSVVSDSLYQVNPHDPIIYAGVIGLLAAATVLACLAPARRATKVDPLVALRHE